MTAGTCCVLFCFLQLLIRVFGLSILWSGCGALRVAIPKEAQVFRDKIIADALSYSYSALEFGAPNETQFKSWSLVKNLSQSGHTNKSQYEYGIEDNRGGREGSPPRKQKQWSNHQSNHSPTKKTVTSSAAPPPSSRHHHQSLRPTFDPTLVSDIYPQYGFHPLLFSTQSPALAKQQQQQQLHTAVFNYAYRSSTAIPPRPDVSGGDSPPSRLVLTSGISVGGDSKKASYKQLGRPKKGKPRNRFRKGKLRPVGLDHFNLGVQQAIHVSPGASEFYKPPASTTTLNPFPNLSPGYSRVTQNLPNSQPSVVYGTNHLDGGDQGNNGNNSWIPILGPIVRAGASNGGGGGNNSNIKGKKIVNLTRILKNKARPRHRYSSNYSSRGGANQSVKVRSHRLAGILSQNPQMDVIAVYPNHKNYSTVTARSRKLSTTTTDNHNNNNQLFTTTVTSVEPKTTTEAEIIHARITKIPNLSSQDVVLNVTTQFPVVLDEKVRARLKAIRKIVRRLP